MTEPTSEYIEALRSELQMLSVDALKGEKEEAGRR